jgi:hypothetical protein
LGRFINADAILGQTGELLGHNIFIYCKNNPVNNFDPNGYRTVSSSFEEIEIIVVAVAVIGTLFSVTREAIGNAVSGAIQDTKTSIKTYTKNISKSKSINKTITTTSSSKNKQRAKYFEATTIKSGGILIGNPLTIENAQIRLLSGNDVYASTQLHAVYLAGTLGGTERDPDYPDIHEWSPENKYHYHLKGHVGGHIFFD